MGSRFYKLKQKKKNKKRFQRKSAKDAQHVLDLAYEYQILQKIGKNIEFTDQYRQAVANAMDSLSIDTSTPANLITSMRQVNILAIVHQAGSLRQPEILQLLRVVEAVTGIHKSAETICAVLT